MDSACLIQGDRAWIVRESIVKGMPHSPVTRLIQGIYENEPKAALKILREPIWISYASSRDHLAHDFMMCYAMVKTAAKRMVFAKEAEIKAAVRSKHLVDLSNVKMPWTINHRVGARLMFDHPETEAMAYALALEEDQDSQKRYLRNRRVAALLISEQGELLMEATNQNAVNKTLHAEVILVQRWWALSNRPLPKGSTIYTTLQSCKMCAGILHWSSLNPATVSVVYARPEPGPAAKNRVIDMRSDSLKEKTFRF